MERNPESWFPSSADLHKCPAPLPSPAWFLSEKQGWVPPPVHTAMGLCLGSAGAMRSSACPLGTGRDGPGAAAPVVLHGESCAGTV